mmetsp:Transcript_119831/g.284728  ORF Transcript_119831/g.284728 Transcript_119831/m.284728 type:complete len:240 (-) Transcript_119831:7-726(-)
MTLMATFAASAHRSACDSSRGTYFSAMGCSKAMPFCSPELAGKSCSPLGRRILASGRPSLPLKTPASCQESRIKIGPQFLVSTKRDRSSTKNSWVKHRQKVSSTISALHSSSIFSALPCTEFTFRMLSPGRILADCVSFHLPAAPPLMDRTGRMRRQVTHSTDKPKFSPSDLVSLAVNMRSCSVLPPVMRRPTESASSVMLTASMDAKTASASSLAEQQHWWFPMRPQLPVMARARRGD